MFGTDADLERAVALLGMRSRLVQEVVHGHAEWTVLLNDHLVHVEPAYGLDEQGWVVISFLLPNSPADGDAYHLHANGEYIQTEPGTIVKGRNCRLRMVFPVEDSQRADQH